ncbi:hypothetical protein K469DRAFT_689803 [Zopfia rhizophila CBS 207.26]|uniref:Uncharacterized protein n=1 Tax=Zopfia rhizophila CBS 207.26 TaxID=1314779 RepID=A0A6A6E184_9PEZI|nr:hypothetical protein K469DRAFT_689803 [Zopfia rhizophila CBS 207.26]
MQAFLSRRIKFLVLLSSSLILVLIFVQLYSNGIQNVQQSITSHLPTFGGEPLIIANDGKGSPKKDEEVVESLLDPAVPPAPTVLEHGDEQHEHERPQIFSSKAPQKPPKSNPTSTMPDIAGKESLQAQSSSSQTASNPPKSNATPAPPKSTGPTGAIVAAVGVKTDLKWISEIKSPLWTLHRYNHDDPFPPPSASFPINKGNEAMMYLSYIINNYDSLPDYSIFIHGHRTSWHQEGDMVDMINGLRFSALQKAGYVPLRCDWYPSCPREIRPVDHDAIVWGPGVHREDAEREIGNAWLEFFGPHVELPRTIASQCCAQFAVTRDAIRGRPKGEYERMRQWLVNTELINDISGRVLEKLWAYIFTKEAVRCPPPQQCACEYFGQCGPKEWPIPPEGLEKWPKEFDAPPMPKMNETEHESHGNMTARHWRRGW